jgi:hypothetical protein
MYPLQALKDTGWLDYKISVFLLAHDLLLAALEGIQADCNAVVVL